MSKFQTEDFKKLKEKWYSKLKSSGFNDIEQDENHLKEWDSFAFTSRYNKHLFNSKETYYRYASQFLHDYNFPDKRQQVIWELHSSGKTITQISQELKKRRFKSHNRSGVHVTIQALAKEMLKNYAEPEI
jgi:hypothetical protein